MELVLHRRSFTPNTTIGDLYIDGNLFCQTLEDVDRGLLDSMAYETVAYQKVPGKTAIPYGTYPVIINHSNRFNKEMPLLKNVKAFEGVRIHSGNLAADTEGCILVGRERDTDYIRDSRLTFTMLFQDLIKAVGKNEQITISIVKDFIA